MNIRNLTPAENEKAESLIKYQITYELLFLTDTGLGKGILDATAPVVELLKNEKIHDYESQAQGPDHKIIKSCIILSDGLCEEANISLYRPETKKGDPRFWPSRFSNYASPNQVFALYVVNKHIVFINLSDGQPFNESDYNEIIKLSSDELTVEEAEVEESDSREVDEPSRFEISSYGWDSDVEGLVKRIQRGDIKVPGFQRKFVWNKTEQSRFIESLILGLPVPNIFLAKDSDTKTLNVIDGQQRLKTLENYLSGEFPISNTKSIHEDFRGRYFNVEVAKTPQSKVLEEADARALSDSIIHSIVIRPDPSSDSTSYGHEYNNAVIQIFRRLNTSGKPLQPQEVRSCIFYGPFDDMLHELNGIDSWRNFFGAEHNRCKDVETILRFFALYENFENYKAPMPSFLDRYMEENRNMDAAKLDKMHELFVSVVNSLFSACGPSLFKNGSTFLLSKFDAITVGFAKYLSSGKTTDLKDIREKVAHLMDDPNYMKSTIEFINDTDNVTRRIKTAIEIFAG
uniref:DUF262 domain-containing protein n=1 Tax=Cellvibrio fontiphilus TaxID=1815559 RepID=UPI002B4C21C0|nr:DUF262 domain-containing protein [Cellvibrio fontiphilus]